MLIAPLCRTHEAVGTDRAARSELAEGEDGTTFSMGAPWGDLGVILEAVHGGSNPLCRSVSVTFVVNRGA